MSNEPHRYGTCAICDTEADIIWDGEMWICNDAQQCLMNIANILGEPLWNEEGDGTE